MNRMMKGYYRAIRRNLVAGSRQEKKEFLAGFARDVESFVEENPASSIQDIKSRFGEPEEIAEGFLSSLDNGVVKSAERRRALFRGAILLAAIVVIALLVLYVVDTWMFNHGYIVEQPAQEGLRPTPESYVGKY